MYMEMFRLDGRIALVTGGGQAIGLACVERPGRGGRPCRDRRLQRQGRGRKPATR